MKHEIATESQIEAIKNCDINELTQYSSFSFNIQRDDSRHASYVKYFDLSSRTSEIFTFDNGMLTLVCNKL